MLLRGRTYLRKALLAGLVPILIGGQPVSADEILTIEEVRQRAIEFNRQYLSAREDVAIAQTEISRAWGDALPEVSFNGNYNRSFAIPRVFFVADGETVELQTGFKNSFGANVSVRQPIWHGGRVFTALIAAKMYKRYSQAIAESVEAEVVYNAEQLFYSVTLARAQLSVLQKALESNSANLDVVEKQYSQGVVSEYEVLRARRARVERQNLLPEIIRGEAQVELSEKRLRSFLGIDLDERTTIIEEQTDTTVAGLLSLEDLTDSALVNRPEVKQAQELVDMSHKAIRVARADYWPSFDAVGVYNWQSVSDDFTLSGMESSSWTAGLTVSMSIFDGGKTRALVTQRKAENKQAKLNLRQIEDNITLEVEESYTELMQAKRALDIQGATIASAEEGLRIARVRYESGVGTQLEVLSAQTALTDARTALTRAMFGFRVARAGIKKATTLDI
jgi:outer membrane protein TolC